MGIDSVPVYREKYQRKRNWQEPGGSSIEWILITGASGKLGVQLTRRMIETRNNALFLHYFKNRPAIEKLLKTQKPGKRPIKLCRADLTTRSGIRHLVRRIRGLPGRVGIFVHLASLFEVTPLEDLDLEIWMRMVYIHTLAPLSVLREVNGRWSAQARVIFISDAGVGRGYRKYLGYTMSKAMLDSALPSLVKILPEGVTVHGVAPYRLTEGGEKGDHAVSYQAVVDLIEWLIEHGAGCTGRLIILDGGRFLG